MDISEAIILPDDELDFVVGGLNCCGATNTLKGHGWLFNFLFPEVIATLD